MYIFDRDRAAGGYEAITVSNTSGGIGFSKTEREPVSGLYKGSSAQTVFCTLETAQIRFTLDGTAPTTSVGHLLEAGQTLTIKNPGDIKNFRAIRTGSDASLKCTYRF